VVESVHDDLSSISNTGKKKNKKENNWVYSQQPHIQKSSRSNIQQEIKSANTHSEFRSVFFSWSFQASRPAHKSLYVVTPIFSKEKALNKLIINNFS
jgi:hypothetical protein